MDVKQYMSQSSNRRRIKQPASVPFLWEVRPGLPKKDWKHIPSTTPINPIELPPVKLVDSVPFEWEEMPGKPLPSFPKEMLEAAPLLLLPPPMLPAPTVHSQMPEAAPLPLLPPPMLVDFDSQSTTPTVHSQNIWDNADDDGCDGDDDDGCDGDDEKDEMFDPYLDAWGFEINEESSSSAPSLLANRLIATFAISNAVPVEEIGRMDRNSRQLQQAPSSLTYDSDSSTSSYATGNTSLVEESLLERLFPLLLPKSTFLGKLGCEKRTDITPQTVPAKDLEPEIDRSLVGKRPFTLQELILISRRRSYHMKAIIMRDQNLSMELMKKSALGCCMVRSGNIIKRLQGKWKKQLQLPS